MERVLKSVGCRKKISFFFFAFWMFSVSSAQAFNPGMPPLEESAAFKQFIVRPRSSLSTLIYLIDRFKEAKIKIVYAGNYFEAPFAANLAKWFLKAKYKGETPEQWILRWCDTDILESKPIWVRDNDNEFKMSREVLFEELKILEARCAALSQKASQPGGGTAAAAV